MKCNLKQAIVAGIFRQLYYQGRNNHITVLNTLLEAAKNLKSNQMVELKPKIVRKTQNLIIKKNFFSIISDSSMSHIGSYLKTKELFSIFNRICKRSFKIGMKPTTIQHWLIGDQMNSKHHENNYYSINKFTKFDIDHLLSNVKQIKYRYNRSTSCNSIPKCCSNSVTILDTDILSNEYGCRDKIEKLSYTFPHWPPVDMQSLQQFGTKVSHMSNLKQLTIVNCGTCFDSLSSINEMKSIGEDSHDAIIENEENLLQLLQAIIPLSQKEKEIEERILTLATEKFEEKEINFDQLTNGFVTPNVSKIVLEKITQQAIKEIESKLNLTKSNSNTMKCDENELTYGIEERKKCKNDELNLNSLEMLEFDDFNCCFLRFEGIGLRTEEEKFIKHCITRHNRINKSMSKLRACALHGNYEECNHWFEIDELILQICICLLDAIGRQLISLHISDVYHWNYHGLKFVKMILENLSKNQDFKVFFEKFHNETWYLVNVEELCFEFHFYSEEWVDFFGVLLSIVNHYTFPQLKHLKCHINYTSANNMTCKLQLGFGIYRGYIKIIQYSVYTKI